MVSMLKQSWRRVFLAMAVVAGGFVGLGASTGRADDYWTRHWGWYDGPYQTYYYRSPYADPYYGRGYQYGPPPRTTYYNQPYRSYYYRPGGSVRIGPLRFGWW